MYAPHCLYQKEGNCVIHTICVWPSFYVSESGKLYHTCNMFMFWSLCSRKREAVSYIQHVYDLDFMNRKGWNCIIPSICLCSGVCVSEGGNCVILSICLCSRYCVSERGETVSYLQYVYVIDFVHQKEGNYITPTICLCSRFCVSEREELFHT